jgi:hypothetical protein
MVEDGSLGELENWARIREDRLVKDILRKFLSTFDLAIAREMDAMRERMGPFEIELGNGQAQAGPEHAFAYLFDVFGSDESLVVGMECTLKRGTGESIVTVGSLGSSGSGGRVVTLFSGRELRALEGPASLVIYPWFLYERLRAVLSEMGRREDYFFDSALRTFGKLPAKRAPVPRKVDLSGLNESQQAAVGLCAESDLAFVWGPPGTGKTYTLAKITEELLAQGHRVLLASTTNAAVDQALEKLAATTSCKEAIERGDFVRIGRSEAPTFGAGLREVVDRQGQQLRDELRQLRASGDVFLRRIRGAEGLLVQIDATLDSAQGQLFGETQTPDLSHATVSEVFSAGRAATFAAQAASEQRRRVERRLGQLLRADAAAKERGSRLTGELAAIEAAVVSGARLVLATMTNAYFSRLLEGERYDVVIIEEAGMATLPTLFYCAALARERVVLVGDPRQLPPIIQSRNEHVLRFMGRSIFDVTVPQLQNAANVALLDTQYRMHPLIGDLVSELYYERSIRNDVTTADRKGIAESAPFAGQPIAVVDTGGQTQCAHPQGSQSRYNEKSAAICLKLAREAISAQIASVAIITPYAEQSRLIRKALREAGLQRAPIECSTVHRFQGNERDLVILDAVDAEPLRPGVLLAGGGSSSRNLLNVSLSRARGKLILVADVAYFETRAPGSAMHEALRAAMATVGTVSTLTSSGLAGG